MRKSGAGAGRRAQLYAYTFVTTAIVLVFALVEWAAERYIADRSRAAGIAVEVAVVLVAALVFRPVHRRVEEAVEGAFYRRRRQALAALAKFRRELTSFKDREQLLRRVVDAVEQHLEAMACAIYLKRDVFHAEASSFDVAAKDVDADDPLVVRLRSSGAPARPSPLGSAALGTHAFPMTVAGELVGVLCVQCPHSDYDAEETQMLGGLAQDLALALVALDPSLRPRGDDEPGNIPTDTAALVGREREIEEVKAALTNARLVTITGPGGVGKTRLALACAAALRRRYEDGCWFVNLAPISDGSVVAATMLAALDAGAIGAGDENAQLVEHLRTRNVLLVVDNCEQLVAEVAAVVARVYADCPRVTILATSRELLRLDGEHVYRLGPLRAEAAFELFSLRASAVAPDFAAHECAATVRDICEQLDGIPLAIELAAARVRALSANDILEHLHERFRLLTSSTRTALPRQQTLAATIEWSYDLLAEEEQSLFLRLSAFRGSFSLAAAVAVCAQEGRCDEFHVLDVLTSLADKSLLTATVTTATRYRLLETIREFVAQKCVERQASAIAATQHAQYFAALAAQAYYEFDTHLQPGWLERLAPDVDNFRAALAWTLDDPGERLAGAQMAADCGPLFLRMNLLREGLQWCVRARAVDGVASGTAGRIEYVASMLHNNLAENDRAIECAERAVSFYEASSDERGLIRALSQVAQVYARAVRYDDAKAPAAEAIRRARLLGEPRVLVAVLRRCAFSLPPTAIDDARRHFAEALDIARTQQDPEEVCIVLEWWAFREASSGALERAIDLASQSLTCASRSRQLYLESHIACWALALGHIDDAAPHARRALALAVEAKHEQLRARAVAYCAPLCAERDPVQAALLFGYAKARLQELGWNGTADDALAIESASQIIQARLRNGDFASLLERGARWTDDQALSALDAAFSMPAGNSSAGASRS